MAGNVTYSNCSPIIAGCYLYNDIYKTSPVTSGYYSDETNCYTVTSGGYVSSVATCCRLYLTISATYANTFEMTMQIDIVGGTPSYGFDVSFDWCTDSGADGTTTFYVNAGYTTLGGTLTNLSSSGLQGGSTSWGTHDVDVTTTSSSAVTQMYVKGSTLTFSSSDPDCSYYITYENIDNSCTTPSGPVYDECFKGCL